MTFDPDALLAALPKRVITYPQRELDAAPRLKAVSVSTEYNGFTAQERSRTSAVAAWLELDGWIAGPEVCGVRGNPAALPHAEDYYALESWIDICRGCHARLHMRFRWPDAWPRSLDLFEVAGGHWARLVSPRRFDLAGLLRGRGVCEPTLDMFLGRARAMCATGGELTNAHPIR